MTAHRLLMALSAGMLFVGLTCLVQAQVPSFGFPPGMFHNRAALDAGAAAYSGPGDVVSGAKGWWGLRGYNAAYVGNAANICTPLDAVCLDVTIVGGSLNTTTLGTLACNNLTTICTVKTLYDQSGANNCSGSPCDFAQATIANRPSYVAPGAANGCPTTALPCMQFMAASSQRFVTGSLTTIAQPDTFSVVGQIDSDTGAGQWFIIDGGPQAGVAHSNGSGTWIGFAGAVVGQTATNGAFHAGQFVLNGVSSSSSIDGSTATGDAGTSNAITLFRMGTREGFTEFLNGKVVEIGVWAVGFNGTQIGSMNSNQHSYWGF